MKKIFYINFLIALVGCQSLKNSNLKSNVKANFQGLYSGEVIPSDVGGPNRNYLYFKGDSVFGANLSVECYSVDLLNDNFMLSGKIEGNSFLKFAFEQTRKTQVDNLEVYKKYKTNYSCVYSNGDTIKLEISQMWYDGTLFYKNEEVFVKCK